MSALNVIALILVIVGGLNWGLISANVDAVATIFGSPGAVGARVVYGIVGVAALYSPMFVPKVTR